MTNDTNINKRVIIVGSGFSGLGCAIKLLERGYTNLTIYEKNAEVGGTWETNRYPGLTCDMPALAYTFSFERRADFSQQYAGWREIREYCKTVAKKYDLYNRIKFNTEITDAYYDEGTWKLKTKHGDNDTADVVVMATGVLRNLNIPDITGVDSFAGTVIHTGQWDDTLDLKGKKVGVIGNGATSAQLIPAIIDEVGELTLFQRTAQWINPLRGGNSSITEEQREKLHANPARLKDITDGMLEKIEMMVDGLLVDTTGTVKKSIDDACQSTLASVSDPELRRKLTPEYKPGCKRLITSDSFYPAMEKDNAILVTDSIENIEEKGVRTNDGKLHELDVIILATGYRMHDYMRPMKIHGEEGVLLDDIWSEGEFAHRGIAIPSFPNLFMIMGPNSPLTNYSVIEVAEWQINYIIPLIEKVLSSEASVIKVDPQASKEFNNRLIEKSPETIWSTGCDSYYLKQNGLPNVWPDTVASYREAMKKPDMSEYLVEEQ